MFQAEHGNALPGIILRDFSLLGMFGEPYISEGEIRDIVRKQNRYINCTISREKKFVLSDALSQNCIRHWRQILHFYQNTKGNITSSSAKKADAPEVSVTLKLAPSHPLILIMPFILPSSDVKASSPFSLSTKVPFSSPCL